MIRKTVLLFGLFVAAPALAQSGADLAEIDRAVAQFTGNPIGSPGGAAMPVDRRLRLATCPGPLGFAWHGDQHASVEVRCPYPGGWRLYVPISGAGNGAAQADAINRGDAVAVIVSGDGFAVSQSGEALEAGPEGGWIRVRMGATGAPVLRAKVLRPGAVGIALP